MAKFYIGDVVRVVETGGKGVIQEVLRQADAVVYGVYPFNLSGKWPLFNDNELVMVEPGAARNHQDELQSFHGH